MDTSTSELLYMPTWTIAAVCAVFVVSCLFVERVIFFIGDVFRKKDQKALFQALEKIKEELMLVGFISLALTVGQDSIVKLCIPSKWSKHMLQCKKDEPEEIKREAFSRILEEEETQSYCSEGNVPFMQLEGMHQLHILLFVLVIVHVIYSVMIMALGMWKVSQWKAWEERSCMAESLGEVRLTRDVTFIRRHAANRWSKNKFLAYLAAFFQQFFMSVSETDYLTLRHGFIVKHNLGSNYNFHMYILRSLEEDFKDVVGVSPYLWGCTILLILLNVDGWKVNFIAPILPLAMVLVVGMKLRYIITEMAVQYYEKHAVVEGIANVKPTDELFWFGKPHIILYLVHFILFQDAYQVSLHLWSTFTFSGDNCLSRHPYVLLLRLFLGILAQVTLGYVMLPIYAVVSQMGSEMRRKVVNDSIVMQNGTNSGDNICSPSGLVISLNDESAPISLIAMSEEFGQRQETQLTSNEKYPQNRVQSLNAECEPCPNDNVLVDEVDLAADIEDGEEHRYDTHLHKKMSSRLGKVVHGGDYYSL